MSRTEAAAQIIALGSQLDASLRHRGKRLSLSNSFRILRIVLACGAKKVVRSGMCADFQGFTQIRSGGGFTVSSLGLHARRLAQSAAADVIEYQREEISVLLGQNGGSLSRLRIPKGAG